MKRPDRAALLVALPALLLISGSTEGAGGRLLQESRVAGTVNARAGRAFVFSGADANIIWTLNAPDVITGARFGETVAGIGDVNGDMIPDLAVGASGASEGKFRRAGRVYIFSGSDGLLLRTISAPVPAGGIRFGFAIAAAGDLNADGAGDLIVGAPRARTPGKGRTGAAYALSGSDGTLLATLAPAVPRRGSQFGVSAAAGTDVTGDGQPDLVVGAPAERASGRRQVGAVYIFDAQGAVEAALSDPAPQAGARFGESVAFTSDASGDAIADLVIGADGQSFTIDDFAGAVYLFSAAGSVPAFIKRVYSPSAEFFANFGFAVTGLSDLNGDGIGDFAGAAPDEDLTSFSAVGRVYVIGGDPNTPTIATLDDPAPHFATFFGGAIAALPDLTADGLPELAVGAELHKDPNGIRAGRAYVVQAKTGAAYLTIESPTGDVCARFGWAVAPAGDVDGDGKGDIIVGAPFQRVTSRYATDRCF